MWSFPLPDILADYRWEGIEEQVAELKRQDYVTMNGGPFIDIFEPAKEVNSRVVCYYHSNGNIESVIPDLIEIEVEILNPVQPECMDPLAIRNDTGNN